MRIVLPGINCLVDFANFVNSQLCHAASRLSHQHRQMVRAPSQLRRSSLQYPASIENDPLQGTPIVFWGAPVGTVPARLQRPIAYAPADSHRLAERLLAIGN